jgi:protein-S-isoprenylcysteine O-methyltransferase Ste14
MNSGMVELVLFGILSVWLLYFSRKSLRVPGSHGFYRFFAWEAILALILINRRAWFSDPLAVLQIVSWLLLFASLIMVGQGFTKLRRTGQPGSKRQDGTLLDFEKTSTLVTSGIYRHIRHPLYGEGG